jgi:hypothetical protein
MKSAYNRRCQTVSFKNAASRDIRIIAMTGRTSRQFNDTFFDGFVACSYIIAV